MQFIIIDEPGYLRTLADKIKEEGFDAIYYPRWKSELAKLKPDVVIANTYKPLHHLDHVLIGLTQAVYNIMIDREYTQKFMKVQGVQMPVTHLAQGGQVDPSVIKKGVKYAIDSHFFPPYFTIEAEDALAVLQMSNELHGVLQVREALYAFEMEIEAWFNGSNFMNPPYLILDSVIMHPLPLTSNLYKETLGKLEDALKKIAFRGPLSMRIGVSQESVFGLSIDCKFRPMVFESLKKPAELTKAVVAGSSNKLPIYWAWTEQVPLVLDVSLMRQKIKLPVLGLNSQNRKHLWLARNEHSEDGHFIYTGVLPTIGYITAMGETPRECNRRIDRTRSNLVIPYTLTHPVARRVQEREKLLMEWHLI